MSWRTSCCCWTRWTGRRTLPSWTTSPWMRTATILAFRWHSDILMNDAGKAAIIGLRSLPQVVQFSSFRWSAEHISWTFPSNYQPWKLNLGERKKKSHKKVPSAIGKNSTYLEMSKKSSFGSSTENTYNEIYSGKPVWPLWPHHHQWQSADRPGSFLSIFLFFVRDGQDIVGKSDFA